MSHRSIRRRSIAVMMFVSVAALGGVALAAQDRFTLKAPNGIGLAEFRGYDTWQSVAVSQVDDGIKVIAANQAMIDAFRAGIPGNGKPFPEGSKIAKIEWSQKKNPESPYAVTIPDTLKSLSFIEKDSTRFKDTNGWGYAQFIHDAAADTFTPFGDSAAFGKEVCHACHEAVAKKDFIFTAYPRR